MTYCVTHAQSESVVTDLGTPAVIAPDSFQGPGFDGNRDLVGHVGLGWDAVVSPGAGYDAVASWHGRRRSFATFYRRLLAPAKGCLPGSGALKG